MPRRKREIAGYGKLLDAWSPPSGAGAPVGCLATTFTFQADFFEEHCLARFLQIDSDPQEESLQYLIEREERLAQISAATVLVDARHCKGRRNLRWDTVPFRAEPGSLLHAKISLLRWQHLVRIIVSSANLTASGYRHNREVFGVLDYRTATHAPVTCLNEILEYLETLLDRASGSGGIETPALKRSLGLLNDVRRSSGRWGRDGGRVDRRQMLVKPVLTAPGRRDVLSQLGDTWPGAPIRQAYVTSPFFDKPERVNLPAKKIWELMAKRGDVRVTYTIDAKQIKRNLWSIRAPETIRFKPDRNGAEVVIERLEEEARGIEEEDRELHMKRIWLADEGGWTGLMIGSSNFTSRGLGLIKNANYEANLFYLVHQPSNENGYNALWRVYPQGPGFEKADKFRWDVETACGGDEPVGSDGILPAFFRCAVFGLEQEGEAYVEIHFNVDQAEPDDWVIRSSTEGDEILTQRAWDAAGKPAVLRLVWQRTAPPAGFEVTIPDSEVPAWLPVEIADANALPPPSELRQLSLDDLIAVLTSARPLNEVLGRRLAERARDGASADPEIDPHKRVNVSGFLLQRTRRVASALTALRERLEKPVPTEESLLWRLYGPVGAVRMADLILEEAHSTEERCFLLVELCLELSSVVPNKEPGCLKPARIEQEIRKLIRTLAGRVSADSLDHVPSMRDYVSRALARAGA